MSFRKLLRYTFYAARFRSFQLWPEATLKAEFRRRTACNLNLSNPETFNEKLQWLKLHWYDSNATMCADKFAVREHVRSKGLAHLLNDLYGVYDDIDDIKIDSLPDKFVMKVTHGCGQNLVCTDKSKIDWEVERRKFKDWLKRSHYFYSLEWVYRDIQPKIIVEKLIETTDGKPPKDYKFFCFNGEPKCLFVAGDRGKYTTTFDFYDLDWNHLSVTNHYPNSGEILPRPSELDDLIKYSRIISEGFPHVRVDFYIEQGQVIFGECTFFHFSVTYPLSQLNSIMKWVDI